MLASAGGCGKANVSPAPSAAGNNTRYPQTILIIRHAEKTGDPANAHLSVQGQHRAALLYQLFLAADDRPDPFPTPDFLFAASKTKDSQRPMDTLTPLAAQLKLPIHDSYTSKLPGIASPSDAQEKASESQGIPDLRDELFGESKYFGKTILIAWRHTTIAELAKTLKAREVPTRWDDDVFDRVWQINYDDYGTPTFMNRPQRLLPG